MLQRLSPAPFLRFEGRLQSSVRYQMITIQRYYKFKLFRDNNLGILKGTTVRTNVTFCDYKNSSDESSEVTTRLRNLNCNEDHTSTYIPTSFDANYSQHHWNSIHSHSVHRFRIPLPHPLIDSLAIYFLTVLSPSCAIASVMSFRNSFVDYCRVHVHDSCFIYQIVGLTTLLQQEIIIYHRHKFNVWAIHKILSGAIESCPHYRLT